MEWRRNGKEGKGNQHRTRDNGGRMERSNDALRDEWMGGEGISGLGDEEGIPPMNLIGHRELEGIGQI